MTTPPVIIPLCRHIKTNGLRCQSPALTGETFCFFHARLHHDHPAPLTAQKIVNTWNEGMVEAMISVGDDPMQIARAYPKQNEFNFPPLEDAESIQLAASMLFHAISLGVIHLGRARILLNLLKIANSSHRLATASPQDLSETVREIDRSSAGLPLAQQEARSTPENTPADHAATPQSAGAEFVQPSQAQ